MSLINYATLVPTFGDFCGPEWSAGQRTSTISLKELQEAPVLDIPFNGVSRPSHVDLACKVHDTKYKLAENKLNEAVFILQADENLVVDMKALNPQTLTKAENEYRNLLIRAFEIKILYDRYKVFMENPVREVDTGQEKLKSFSSSISSPPPVKVPLTPEEAKEARKQGAAIAAAVTHVAKTKVAVWTGMADKAKNLVKTNLLDGMAKELNTKLKEARHKIEKEAALAQGSLVEMPDPFNQDLFQHEQDSINSQFFDENGLLKIYQTELDDLLNTDFSTYLPKTDEPKPIEIDNSRSPRIHVNPNPAAYRDIEGEGDAVHRVAAGYLARRATHSVGYGAGFLFNTDFVSTQQASMASGGVRPGAVQLDPNPKPNEYLQANFQFDSQDVQWGSYVSPLSLSIARAKQNFLNAAALGSLASGSIQQVYIDPILLDLTGQGVRMTPYTNQGVLFDMEHSGTLRRTGWADTKTGILVDSKGTDKVRDVSQMFSEYYRAQAA